MNPVHTAIGTVRHVRLQPRPHAFSYPLRLIALDLERAAMRFDAIPGCGWRRPAGLRFHRGDYLGDTRRSLPAAVADLVQARLRQRPQRVRLIGQLRSAGCCFNPVVFYVCADAAGAVLALVADIVNTPWGERHAYVLDCRDQPGPVYRFRFDKDFHVSPFWGMDQQYDWRFHVRQDRFTVVMRNWQDGQVVFTASMQLRLQPARGRDLRWLLLRSPLQGVLVLARIYYQAARLWWRRTPFHPHPKQHLAA